MFSAALSIGVIFLAGFASPTQLGLANAQQYKTLIQSQIGNLEKLPKPGELINPVIIKRQAFSYSYSYVNISAIAVATYLLEESSIFYNRFCDIYMISCSAYMLIHYG